MITQSLLLNDLSLPLIVSLPQGKSAQLLYSMQEMDDGGGLL